MMIALYLVSTKHTGRFLKKLKKQFQDKLAHANSTAEESISNVITVRSFSNERKMINLYSEDIDKSYRLGRKLALMIGTFMGTVSMFMYVSWTVITLNYEEIRLIFKIEVYIYKGLHFFF